MALSKLTLAPARTLMRQAARGMARKPIVGGNWKCNPATASRGGTMGYPLGSLGTPVGS